MFTPEQLGVSLSRDDLQVCACVYACVVVTLHWPVKTVHSAGCATRSHCVSLLCSDRHCSAWLTQTPMALSRTLNLGPRLVRSVMPIPEQFHHFDIQKQQSHADHSLTSAAVCVRVCSLAVCPLQALVQKLVASNETDGDWIEIYSRTEGILYLNKVFHPGSGCWLCWIGAQARRAHVLTQRNTHTHSHTLTYTHLYAHAHVRTHTHTHTHTLSHTLTLAGA